MKKSIIDVYDSIIRNVRLYLRTAYLTRSDEFNITRDDFISDQRNGPMFRTPLFEIQDRYEVAGKRLNDLPLVKELTSSLSTAETAATFKMLEKLSRFELYSHQVEAIESALIQKQHVVVTTGTGSGKTLTFLIPAILNILGEAIGNKNRSKWVGHGPAQEKWWEKKPFRFHPRRSITRAPGLRAMFMYPLNALVQDQVQNLRSILDGAEADEFYSKILKGERIYFGQYNGATAGRGQFGSPDRLEECAKRLKDLEEQYLDADSE